MITGFAAPLALWALAALALPLLLHLARRERQRRTVFAALAWLLPRQRPRRRLRLQEWPLLVLRMALLAALALLLAQPLRTPDPPGAWELVHPVLSAPAGEAPEGIERRWLAPGFPPTSLPAPSAESLPVASLLRQADAELPAQTALTVRLPRRLAGLDAQALALSRVPVWQIEDAADTASAAAPVQTRGIALRGDADAASRRWLRALHAAWQAEAGDAAAPDEGEGLPASGRLTAWTGAGPVPATLLDWVAQGGELLLDADTAWPLPSPPANLPGDWLRGLAHGRGRVLQWRTPLQPEHRPELLEADFPSRLRAQLWPPPAPTLADAEVVKPAVTKADYTTPPTPWTMPLLWLALALFALERWLGTLPGREATT
ncbi:BatA domain-containing protein [Arenimonas fontis]|uniref:Aerotolerance regulator N-terminal domain-containing protein n=1 Tax=Arenimonas fontis TaxID=2608255 RepID=A0A5B2Z8L9_9GAMM|nr:BatA domain-containing protein [Arenimonas fontis]KAA2285058.1 hypothetical protein F0415_07390 [Arenimonas fontis]